MWIIIWITRITNLNNILTITKLQIIITKLTIITTTINILKRVRLNLHKIVYTNIKIIKTIKIWKIIIKWILQIIQTIIIIKISNLISIIVNYRIWLWD
jgi:hypothetical protein